MRLDKDPLDVALDIKRSFARLVTRRRKEAGLDPDYLLGVAVWWLVAFVGLSIVGVRWIPAAIVAAILCWFWPIVLLFDRKRR
jgi:hypothetical protein